ncbi:MAG: DUF4872 domain-containing protein [Chloroflexi bacterium]|nr:MAG: DUF4872 domain-containing protein [Chloroflexota bacterium]MBL1193535.1 DUF4872 domain-containing protein [Chloroflexota bacterium]NOH10826.1 DUF4872 domain-containing protein [Chloroflexota bacterium]
MILDAYKTLGGIQPETANIKNVLTYHGVKAPHTGKPFTEAMLLGIGGGLGATYMLWGFKKREYPSLVIGFRNLYNYPVKFIERLCERVGATTRQLETGGKKKALTNLEQTLADEHPALAWIDLGGAPYYMSFLHSGVKVVYGLEDDKVWVDHLASKPYILNSQLVAEARAKVPSYKNRIMTVEPGGEMDIEAAIRAGLHDQIDYLNASSDSFSLPSIRKWARMMTDTKNKKAWPVVFKGGRGLYGSLRTLYEGIEIVGTGGGGMRGMYADFLDEAAPVIEVEDLKTVATLHRALEKHWRQLAHALLPDSVAVFKKTKDMLSERAGIELKQGSAGLEAITPLNDELHAIKGELNEDFPLSASEISELFENIQSQLEEIYAAEKEALVTLENAVKK